MKVITFSIFKGGTGKTTSVVNTAAALVKKANGCCWLIWISQHNRPSIWGLIRNSPLVSTMSTWELSLLP